MDYSQTEKSGAVEIAFDSKRTKCFICAWYWDGTDEGRILEADEIDGIPVIKLGGYFGRGLPMPFSLIVPDGYFGDGCITLDSLEAADELGVPYDVTEISFTLLLGKHFTKADNYRETMWYCLPREDGGYDIFHPVVYGCFPEGETVRLI